MIENLNIKLKNMHNDNYFKRKILQHKLRSSKILCLFIKQAKYAFMCIIKPCLNFKKRSNSYIYPNKHTLSCKKEIFIFIKIRFLAINYPHCARWSPSSSWWTRWDASCLTRLHTPWFLGLLVAYKMKHRQFVSFVKWLLKYDFIYTLFKIIDKKTQCCVSHGDNTCQHFGWKCKELTPSSWVLEKPPVAHLLKNFPNVLRNPGLQ
jgi:hypothetical protein